MSFVTYQYDVIRTDKFMVEQVIKRLQALRTEDKSLASVVIHGPASTTPKKLRIGYYYNFPRFEDASLEIREAMVTAARDMAFAHCSNGVSVLLFYFSFRSSQDTFGSKRFRHPVFEGFLIALTNSTVMNMTSLPEWREISAFPNELYVYGATVVSRNFFHSSQDTNNHLAPERIRLVVRNPQDDQDVFEELLSLLYHSSCRRQGGTKIQPQVPVCAGKPLPPSPDLTVKFLFFYYILHIRLIYVIYLLLQFKKCDSCQD
jgi:hypothetical protein